MTKSTDIKTPIKLYAICGNLATARRKLVEVDAFANDTLISLGTALTSYYIPKRLAVAALPYFNDSFILPCAVALTEADANTCFTEKVSEIIENKQNEVDLLKTLLSQTTIVPTELKIDDNDVVNDLNESL